MGPLTNPVDYAIPQGALANAQTSTLQPSPPPPPCAFVCLCKGEPAISEGRPCLVVVRTNRRTTILGGPIKKRHTQIKNHVSSKRSLCNPISRRHRSAGRSSCRAKRQLLHFSAEEQQLLRLTCNLRHTVRGNTDMNRYHFLSKNKDILV